MQQQQQPDLDDPVASAASAEAQAGATGQATDHTTSTSTEWRQSASMADPEAPPSDRDGAENVASMEDDELASGSGVSGKAPCTGKEFVPEYSGESPMRDYQTASSRQARA